MAIPQNISSPGSTATAIPYPYMPSDPSAAPDPQDTSMMDQNYIADLQARDPQGRNPAIQRQIQDAREAAAFHQTYPNFVRAQQGLAPVYGSASNSEEDVNYLRQIQSEMETNPVDTDYLQSQLAQTQAAARFGLNAENYPDILHPPPAPMNALDAARLEVLHSENQRIIRETASNKDADSREAQLARSTLARNQAETQSILQRNQQSSQIFPYTLQAKSLGNIGLSEKNKYQEERNLIYPQISALQKQRLSQENQAYPILQQQRAQEASDKHAESQQRIKLDEQKYNQNEILNPAAGKNKPQTPRPIGPSSMLMPSELNPVYRTEAAGGQIPAIRSNMHTEVEAVNRAAGNPILAAHLLRGWGYTHDSSGMDLENVG